MSFALKLRGWPGLLFSLILMVPAVSAQAHTAKPDFANFIRTYAKTHNFTGTVFIEEDGKSLYRGSFGVCDRAFNVPCQGNTKFKIASITKAFTSVLIQQLVESGRIALDAPIKTYLPDYAGEGADTVTIRDLLNHTSGLPNADAGYTSTRDAMARGMPHYQMPATPDELITRYYSGKLLSKPGTTFSYNNADYIVLGKIIEVVTGKPYAQVLNERILAPLAMHDTGLLHHDDIVANLAPSYFTPDKGAALINDMPVYPENWYAAGGMYSTVDDLMIFEKALYGGKLLKAASLDAMLTPGLGGYGFGLWIGNPTFGGKTYRNVNRPGGVMGANGSLYHFNGVGFEKTINIVLLSNTDQAELDGFSWDIGKDLLDK